MGFKISLAHKLSYFVTVNNLYYLSKGEICVANFSYVHSVMCYKDLHEAITP